MPKFLMILIMFAIAAIAPTGILSNSFGKLFKVLIVFLAPSRNPFQTVSTPIVV